MKSVKTDKTDDVVYPCLMEGPLGGVVLFTSHKTGTVVHVGSDHISLGHWTDSWSQPRFTPYTGTVCLSN